MSGVLIVGAGQAGGRLALALGKLGCTAPIRLIGEEPQPPYERPPLSKTVLTGAAEPEDAALAAREAYAAAGIDLRTGIAVTAIERQEARVQIADGSRLGYDRLVLATGCRARAVPLPGAELEGVVSLRSAAEALQLRARLTPGHRLAVIGGGFIGLEVAASARARGCDVTVLEMAPRVLTRSVPEPIALAVTRRHRAEGSDLRTGVGVEAITRTAEGLCLRLPGGEILPADTVLIAAGARPETALAEAAGLAVDNGILTDAAGRTSDPRIWAVGDCSRAEIPRYGAQIRLESFQNADRQAEACARALMGEEVAHDPVPWLWSDQYDWTLHTTGLFGPEQELVARPLEQEGAALVFGLADGRLAAAAGFGPLRAVSQPVRIAQKLIEEGKTAEPSQLADPAVAMKTLLKGPPV